MRLGIFGGTFNPPHMGHIRLVTAIADKLQLDRVLIIPASVPPHKHVLNLARSRDRFEMCRLSFEGDRRFSVSDTELLRVGKSYTYDTLCAGSRKPGFVPELEGKFTPEEIEKIKFIEIPVFEVSSTLIRRRLSERESTQGLISDKVRDYIEQKGLYT